MPYKRKYTKKTTAKKRPRKLQNKNLDRRIKRLEHSEELKYVDFYDTPAVSTTGTLFNYNQIAQGDDFNQRIGEEVVDKYLNLKIRNVKAASVNACAVRYILFWDMQTNATGPVQLASTSLMTGLLDNSTITDVLTMPHNYRTKQRYHILMDKVMVMNGEESTSSKIWMLKKSLNLGGAKIKYGNSGSTVASLTSRSLWLLQIGTAIAVTDAAPQIGTRLWYTDA